MKIAVFLLCLWAITATKASPVIKPPATPASPAVAAPVTTANAPATPATRAVAATPASPSTASKPAVVAPADLVATKYKISFKLANVKYADALASYESGLYQAYEGKIRRALLNLYEDDNSYREMSMIGFRNESGVVADVSLRFANSTKNLLSLDALIKTGLLGDLPVDPASLTAEKDETVAPVAMGYGCGQPCGAPQQCFPSCSSSCCGGSSTGSMMQPSMMGMGQQQFGAPMQAIGGMSMPPMSFPLGQGGAAQCPGQCSSSCAPSCQQSCCGGGGQMNPTMG